MNIQVFGHKIFSRGPSMRLVSIAALVQALMGLGTGRSPSSSGCSPSAHALLSRAQSRSSTLSSAPIMHFLTRPSCRGPLVKFCQPEYASTAFRPSRRHEQGVASEARQGVTSKAGQIPGVYRCPFPP